MTIDYAKLTVSEIKQMLIDEGRFTEDELDQAEVKGKAAWVEVHKNAAYPDKDDEWEGFDWGVSDDIDNIMEDADPMETPHIVQMDPDTPNYNDPEWNDWVMSQFVSGELIDGKYPNVNSLRRMVEKLLGDIVFSGPIKVEQTMDPNHTGKAVVTYQITIDWKLDQYPSTQGINIDQEYPQRTFLSTASSWIGNTDDMYAVFPESIAETRAEGRALRRALRINVVCADELTKKDTAAIVQQQKITPSTTGEWEEESLITDQQINTIKIMCDRLGIGVMKFVNSGSKEYDSINDVTRSAAAGMLKQLNRYQSNSNDSLEIPKNLIGD